MLPGESVYPKISSDPEVQREYDTMRRAGESHALAKMLALRQPPALNGTDAGFNRGRHNNNQFEGCPWLGNHYRAIADRAGVATAGKYYVHGLGRFPGDPKAWVRGLSDVLEVARERNLDIDGLASHRGHEVAPKPDVPLAEDIWEAATEQILEEHPEMRYDDAREKAFDLRTGKVPAAEGI